MAEIKTDNSYLIDKIKLRSGHLPDGEVRVIDCFAGKGEVWRGVVAETGRQIRRLPIDVKDDIGFHLAGDNMAYLTSLDLSRYNAIDLDAYGVPCEQIKTVIERGFSGWVYVTMIQSAFGILPNAMLFDLGFTADMINKTPALFTRRGWEYFRMWLALWGVTRIWHRSHNRKHYLAFNCADRRGAGYNNHRADTAEGLS